MKNFNLIEEEEQRAFLGRIWTFLEKLSGKSKPLPDSIYSALHSLQRLRMGFYECLNQLFHAAAIVCAFEELKKLKKSYAALNWEWNPTQRGTRDEPDLRGKKKDKIIVSAEIKTSHDPEGTNRKTIQNACLKLDKMEGRKIMFVANEKVAAFTKGFVEREKLSVEIISLRVGRVRTEDRGTIHHGI